MDIKRTGVPEKSGESVRAVGRALSILKAYTADDRSLTAAELAGRVNLSLPTLYRLLYTLEEDGFIVSSGDPQRFRLGPAVGELAHAWSGSLDIAQLAEPMLHDIWQQTGETVALFLRQGEHRVCVTELPSQHPLCFKRGIGYRETLVYGASGHAILAYTGMNGEELAAYLRETDIDPDAYAKELAKVRRQGFSVSREEVLKGVVSVAAPFFGKAGEVAGAMVVFGPEARLPAAQVDACAALLVKNAGQLSALLATY
jgi:DNA-binding IclR family transcriptional regulator